MEVKPNVYQVHFFTFVSVRQVAMHRWMSSEVQEKCVCIFQDFEILVEGNRNTFDELKDVPCDEDLMRTFLPEEISHWEDLAASAVQRRQTVADGEAPEGTVGSLGDARYGDPASSAAETTHIKGYQFSLHMFASFYLLLRDEPIKGKHLPSRI